MAAIGKMTRPEREQYEECKGRLQVSTDAEAKACAESVRAGKYLDELPGKHTLRSKGNPNQGSILSDESREARIHAIRRDRLKRWRLMN